MSNENGSKEEAMTKKTYVVNKIDQWNGIEATNFESTLSLSGSDDPIL